MCDQLSKFIELNLHLEGSDLEPPIIRFSNERRFLGLAATTTARNAKKADDNDFIIFRFSLFFTVLFTHLQRRGKAKVASSYREYSTGIINTRISLARFMSKFLLSTIMTNEVVRNEEG